MRKIYYIKVNNEIKKITDEERNEFLKSINNKKYLCPDCKICDCEKIKYTDIRRCEEVDMALLERKITPFETANGVVRHTMDDTLKVYECKRFEPYETVIIGKEKIIANEIVELTIEMLNNKDNTSVYRSLLKLKEEKLKSITNKKVLKYLDEKLEEIKKKQHIKEKKLKLINEKQ